MQESSTIPPGCQSREFVFFQSKQIPNRFDFKILPVGILNGLYFENHLPIKLMKDLDEVTKKRLWQMSEKIENEGD